MTSDLPPSAVLAWWATAWLRGHAATDLVLDAVGADGRLHVGADGTSLASMLGLLRVGGASGCGIALPVAGDPLGLGGPSDLNDLALEVGEALVCAEAGVALVPEATAEVVTWHTRSASRRQLPDIGEADRELRSQTLRAADELAALDVARWRPEVADLLMDGARRRPAEGPPGVPVRCVALADRAVDALAVVGLALDDDGATLSADAASRRRDVLLPLERAARRALVAACSTEAWPPA